MPTVAILGFDGCHASSLSGVADVLQAANGHLRKQRGAAAAFYDWHFVSLSGGSIRASNGLALHMQKIHDRDRFDLVFIPSLYYAGRLEFSRFLKSQASTCDWLRSQWQQGTWLVANCSGTFVLAATGLLDHRVATTTWWLEKQFRAAFPKVDLQLQPAVTEVDRLVCGGAYASHLLQTVRVVEYFSGPSIATRCAKTMLIDVTRTTQTPYLPLLTDKTHSDALVHRAQHWFQNHIAEAGSISDLAERLAVSQRTLIRRFKTALNKSPLTYLQNLRIDTARALLESGDLNVDQVASNVGYSDTSSFSRLFRERVGLTPGEYRGRFHLKNTASEGY